MVLALAFCLSGCTSRRAPTVRVRAVPAAPAHPARGLTLPAVPPAVPATNVPPALARREDVRSIRPGVDGRWESADWISVEQWVAAEPTLALQPLLGPPQSTYQITGPAGPCRLTAASAIAQFDGYQSYLGFAPGLRNGALLVHRLDLEKTIRPLLTQTNAPAARNSTIVIDPGHGGDNPGTRSIEDGTLEKEFTLDWALRLEPLLAELGWRVVLTRREDRTVSLADRTAAADAADAALFISLHFNSAFPRTDLQGVETICLTPRGLPSTITRDYADDPEQEFPNNAQDEANLLYAMRLHRGVITATGAQDRGVRRARFTAVLRAQSRPALLIEGGYLSNPEEARRIATPTHRQLLAHAVAQALGPPPTPTLPPAAEAASTSP